MIRRSDITVSDSLGTPEPGVYITVKDSLGALASLFDDASASLGNPIVSGVGGAFYYNVATPGTYTEEYRLSLSESPRTIRAVSLTASGVGDADYGDITVTGSGTIWTIDPGAVTLTKQASMATASVVYRKSAGSGPPEVQALATLKTDLGLTGTNSGDQTSIVGISGTIAQFNTACSDADFATTALVTSGAAGLAPASGGGATNFLRADGTWSAPPGGGGSGSITASGYTQTTARLLGRTTAATGAIEEISAGATLSLSAGSLGVASVPQSVTFNSSSGAAAGTTFNGSVARTIDFSTVGASPARPSSATPSASFSAADADNNSHKVFSGAGQTLTLGNITAGTGFTGRFTTAWAITCTSLSKNGAAPVSGGNVAANSLITFLHEGAGTWVASGSGLT